MMIKTAVFLFLILAFVFAQNEIGSQEVKCYTDCSYSCGSQCQGGETCTYNCINNCAQKCGLYNTGGRGITKNDDPCNGVTAPDGHPTFLYVGSCVDKYYWEDYCSQAVTCNQCNNLPAYSCIWNGAGCSPCKGSTCIKSCGGGGGTQDNGGLDDGMEVIDNNINQIKIDKYGNAVYPGNQQCLEYTSCSECTKAAQTYSTLAGCKWFPDSGTCIDMKGGIDKPELCNNPDGTGDDVKGGTGSGTDIYNNKTDKNSVTPYKRSTTNNPCTGLGIILLITFIIVVYRN